MSQWRKNDPSENDQEQEESNRDFFAPYPPPNLSLIGKEGDNGPPPIWLPPGWESSDYLLEDSLEALRQWFDFLIGPRGVLVCSEIRERIRKEGRADSSSPFVRDTWRLVQHLKKKGLVDIEYQEEATDYTTHGALVALTRLREQVFPDACRDQSGPGQCDGGKQPSKRSRKSRFDWQRDQEIADSWKRAKDAGIKKKVFSRDKGLSLRDLNRILNRHAKRNRPRK
jgi:hypothetical protein